MTHQESILALPADQQLPDALDLIEILEEQLSAQNENWTDVFAQQKAQIKALQAENKSLHKSIAGISKTYLLESKRANKAEAQLANLQEHMDYMLPH